jgi:hypothetical protein
MVPKLSEYDSLWGGKNIFYKERKIESYKEFIHI